jgi:2',3'-cyclic-nucleotide 2'-phosphodiesterase/3'-nucleotidase
MYELGSDKMRRKFMVLILGVLIGLLAAGSALAAERPVSVRLNNREINFQEAPVLENSRCIVALRPLVEALGAQLTWNRQTGAATVYLPGSILTLVSGNPAARVDGRDILLPVAPAIKNGVLLVPLRAVADIYNIRTAWDASTASVDLYPGGLEAAQPDLIALDVLSVNDFHGALLDDGKNPGAAKLGKWLRDEKAKNPDGTLVLSAGDMYQGSIDSNLLYGKTVVETMNQIGFDAMAIGNHEFDWGLDKLQEQAAASRFPILTANITDKQSGGNLPGTKPWVMIEKKGIKIGIIGLTTKEIVIKVNPKIIAGYNINEPAASVNLLVPELKRQGAQIILVLGHLGGYLDKDNINITGEVTELANGITGVDALLIGHTHQKMAGYINGIPVVQAYYNGRAAGKVALKYSPRTQKVVSAVASVIDLPTPGLSEDAAVKAVINADQKEIAAVKNEVIGKAVVDLAHQKEQVSVLGQWVTDIMRQQSNADFAFQNGGGLRTSIPTGEITVGKLWEVIPFDNTLIQMDLPGSQVLSILQHGINNPHIGSIQYSGMKVAYDLSGQRIAKVTLPDGSVLNPEKTYRVVTNDFMAEGGDGYNMFREGRNTSDTHRFVRDMLIEAIKKTKTLDCKGDDRFQVIGVEAQPAAFFNKHQYSKALLDPAA